VPLAPGRQGLSPGQPGRQGLSEGKPGRQGVVERQQGLVREHPGRQGTQGGQQGWQGGLQSQQGLTREHPGHQGTQGGQQGWQGGLQSQQGLAREHPGQQGTHGGHQGRQEVLESQQGLTKECQGRPGGPWGPPNRLQGMPPWPPGTQSGQQSYSEGQASQGTKQPPNMTLQMPSVRTAHTGDVSCMYIPGKASTQKITYLVDTGCSHNLLSQDVFARLPKWMRNRLEPLDAQAVMADGSGLSIYGSILLPGKLRNV
jgi:hypothetical protein